MNFKPPNGETIVEECAKCGKKVGVAQESQDFCACQAAEGSVKLVLAPGEAEAASGAQSGTQTGSGAGAQARLQTEGQSGVAGSSGAPSEAQTEEQSIEPARPPTAEQSITSAGRQTEEQSITSAGRQTEEQSASPGSPDSLDTSDSPVSLDSSDAPKQAEPIVVPPDGYEIVAKIGSGTFCTAYRARRTGVSNELVIKLLRPEFSNNPRMAKRFLQEVEKAAGIANPGLAPIYQFGTLASGQPFLVTDLFADNLANVIEKEGFLSPGETADVFLQICEGLCAAHEAGILHRSLKPKDIVINKVDENLLVKVIDLGIARATPAQGKPAPYLIPDTIYGDPRYMSPEQCRGERVDERSDIYSLGCMIYEALSGKPPFSGSSPMHTAVKQLEKKPVLLSERFTELEVSAELEALVMKALQKDPAQRYQTMHELQADLQMLKDSAKLTIQNGRHRKPTKHTSSLTRRYFQEALLSLLIVAAIGGLASYLVQKSVQMPSSLDTTSLHATSPDGRPESPDQSSDPSAASTFTGSNEPSDGDATANNKSDQSKPDNDQSSLSKPNADAMSIPAALPVAGKPSTFMIRDLSGDQLFVTRARSLREALERAVKEKVDLSHADLVRAQLSGANLEGAKLHGAQLSGADLSYANCKNSDLAKAQLSGVNLFSSNFSNANLSGTILNEADVRMATLENANCKRAILRDDNFNDANLQNAEFSGAQVYQIDLAEAKTKGIKGFAPQNRFAGKTDVYRIYNQTGKTIFTSSSLPSLKEAVEEAVRQNVSLKDANLAGADLFMANLQGADLQGADLRGALLVQANLTGANLRNARAQGAQLDSAEMQTAVMEHANFTGARFFNTDLRNVSSRQTNLNGAELSGANVSQMNVQGASSRNADFEPWQLSQLVGKFQANSDNSPRYFRVNHKPTDRTQDNGRAVFKRPH